MLIGGSELHAHSLGVSLPISKTTRTNLHTYKHLLQLIEWEVHQHPVIVIFHILVQYVTGIKAVLQHSITLMSSYISIPWRWISHRIWWIGVYHVYIEQLFTVFIFWIWINFVPWKNGLFLARNLSLFLGLCGILQASWLIIEKPAEFEASFRGFV